MSERRTLRDEFAMAAVQSEHLRVTNLQDYELRAMFGNRGDIRREEIIAAQAYAVADAMMKARRTPSEAGET